MLSDIIPECQVADVTLSSGDGDVRLREKLARILVDQMFQFVGVLDTDGRLVDGNAEAFRFSGGTLEEMRGKFFWETLWWPDDEATQEKLKRSISQAAKGEFVRYDVEVFNDVSRVNRMFMDFSLRPVVDCDGKVILLIPEGRNITDRKVLENELFKKAVELDEANERLKQLDKVKNKFFANVSHELRTPLALLLGPVERLLSSNSNLTKDQVSQLALIRRNVNLLSRHVNELLDIVKIESGTIKLNRSRVDTVKLVRSVAAHFESLIEKRCITFVLEVPDELFFSLDAEKFEHILVNLLSNAVKHTPEGGHVNIRLKHLWPQQLRVEVEDSGHGVEVSLREKIFERFLQVGSGVVERYGGLGLGLSIVKEYVALHGGRVGVADAESSCSGALFWFELPCVDESTANLSTFANPESHAYVLAGALESLQIGKSNSEIVEATNESLDERPMVLVVEDNSEMNHFIRETLQAEFRVVSAYDGEEGLQKALSLQPDMMVTDLMMPKMSGDRMIAALRAQSRHLTEVPVLVLSAKSDDEMRIDLLKWGAQDYLTKPFLPGELSIRVRHLVQMKRA